MSYMYHMFREWDVEGKIIKVGVAGAEAGKEGVYKTIGGGVRSR